MKKFIIIICLSLSFLSFNDKSIQKTQVTKYSLYQEILSQNIEFPDIVYAQAILESGNMTSKIFNSNNNLFGMRKPVKRETVAKKTTLYGYAVYESWKESVTDYSLYQKYYFNKHNNFRSRTQYLEYIDKTYSESKVYVKSLKRVMNEHKNIIGTVPSDKNDGVLNKL